MYPLLTVHELSRALHSREISSLELTRQLLADISNRNAQLNCFISIDEESALERAQVADTRLATDSATPLTGIPIAHKDLFCTRGKRTSCGSKMLDNFIAPYDAHIVSLLEQAGMVSLGKTNMDEFAMGSSNETSFYGAVHNPWDLQCTPGGSSGGSAAAVAAGLVPAATGSDTGGSIRQPAAFCGVTGLKPTYGRVSRYGMIAFASSLDQAGPIARTAQDAALLLNAMAGFDPCDATSIDKPVPDYTAALENPLSGLCLGLPKQCFDAELDPDIGAVMETAISVLQRCGATVREISLPHLPLSVPAYYVCAPAECSSNLARFDGVRYGHRCADPQDLQELFCRSRAEGFGAEVKRRILAGTHVLSTGYHQAYYVQAQKIRRLIKDDYVAAFTEVDAICCPTTPGVAFELGSLRGDHIAMYLSDIFTAPANLAGLPAISVPAGFKQGLPVGMQLLGDYFSEARLLNIAHQFQCHSDWHRRRPELAVAAAGAQPLSD